MQIAFLTPEYPHAITGNSGGIGSSIRNLSTALTQKDIAVRILVYGQPKDLIFEEKGIKIQTIKNVKIKGFSRFLTQKKIERIINELYTNREIDLVEAADWTGITSFIRPEKCPIIIRLHGSDTYFCHLDNRPVKWINRLHEKRALENANGHISVSRFTANLTNELFNHKQAYTIIPNGIDSSFFSPAFINHEFHAPVILYFGTIIRKKGVLEIPGIFNEIIKKIPDCKLLLIGKDSADILSGNSSTWQIMREKFNDIAINNVEYKGVVSYENVRQYIIQADVCIFPSFAEALPVSWLEAMALEKAIVTSNIGWAEELIDSGINGFMESPKSHMNFSARIIELLTNENLRLKIGYNARIKVQERFAAELIADENIKFYETKC